MSTHEMIYQCVRDNPCLSEGEIAERVGLRKTPYTRRILLELVTGGYLVRYFDLERKPRAAFVYYAQETARLENN